MSAFERHAVERLIAQARAAGVDVPAEVAAIPTMCDPDTPYAAREWARLHPDDDEGCCWGSVLNGPAGCMCWQPMYEVEQAEPRPLRGPGDLQPAPGMCGDCAFRPGSPERADQWTADALYDSARNGTPFWCHTGMRRPARWVHPDGRVIEGSPDDWHPPIVSGIPYRADGRPGLLCAGWVAVAAHAEHTTSPEGTTER